MALKDTFKNLFNYFEVDEVNEVEEQADAYSMPNDRPKMRVANTTAAPGARTAAKSRDASGSTFRKSTSTPT